MAANESGGAPAAGARVAFSLRPTSPITLSVVEPALVQPDGLPEGCQVAVVKSHPDLQFFDPETDLSPIDRYRHSDFIAVVKRLEDAPARAGRVENDVRDVAVALVALDRLQARAARLEAEVRDWERRAIAAAEAYYAATDPVTKEKAVAGFFEWTLPVKEAGKRGPRFKIDYRAVALDYVRLAYPTGNDADELPMPRLGIEQVKHRAGQPPTHPRECRVLQVSRLPSSPPKALRSPDRALHVIAFWHGLASADAAADAVPEGLELLSAEGLITPEMLKELPPVPDRRG